MTEYEELRKALALPLWSCHERILTSSNIDKILNEQMSIIAVRCWLKDEIENLTPLKNITDVVGQKIHLIDLVNCLKEAGWRPVREIKKPEAEEVKD